MQNKLSSTEHKKLEHFETLCRQKGLPLTVQRRVVLETLLGRADHPTVDQVFDDVKTRVPGISRTTVYRVLETLVRLGVARRTHHFEAAARFDGNVDHHHHLVCLGCDRVVDFEDTDLNQLRLPDTRRTGFEITDYSVQFEGFCADCRKKRPVSQGSKRKS